MPKKPEQTLLIVITLLFAGLMAGIIIGRHTGKTEIHLSGSDTNSSIETQVTNAESDLSGKLNINYATEKELAMLPGIGDTYAKRIVQHREEHGPFIIINDLMNVKGIGEKRFESISKYITVGG